MTSGFVLGPGEGPAYGLHGSAVVIKASGEHTLGQLGVMESAYPPGLSVHEHVHAGEDEMFYLLEGELAVFCGEDHWTVTAGSFVFVPRDRPHGFTVTSDLTRRNHVFCASRSHGPAQEHRCLNAVAPGRSRNCTRGSAAAVPRDWADTPPGYHGTCRRRAAAGHRPAACDPGAGHRSPADLAIERHSNRTDNLSSYSGKSFNNQRCEHIQTMAHHLDDSLGSGAFSRKMS